MKRSMRSGGAGVAAAALIVALALPACRTGDGHSQETLPPAPPTTTTTTIDVTKVPAVIDVTYVQAVVDKLDVVIGDAVRVLVANKGVPNAEFVQLLTAVYGDKQFQREQEDYGSYTGVEPYPIRQDAPNPVTRVTRILGSSSVCVVAEADRDFGPIFVHPPANRQTQSLVQLGRKHPERDPSDRNPTVWAITVDGLAAGASVKDRPCS